MNNLVIVESPTKARTLSRYLGNDYRIEASMGHVRDLPKSDFGIDIEKNFEPQYVIPRDKLKMVNSLKKLAKEAKTLWLATDPDREGEAIAWHLENAIAQKGQNIKRVVFHEITEEAIKDAFKHPRDLDLKLVDAQQARRVLDRLVGYKLSPLLWKKIKRGLSAGRVQSVALRLIVEREREVGAFKPVEYWNIEAELSHLGGVSFIVAVIEKEGKKLVISNEKDAKEHLGILEKAKYQVSKVAKKEVKRYPYPPFTTSTLQQTASNRLGYSAKKTMMLAQNLYEHGLITYMRTDSFNLAPSAISGAREYIDKKIGKAYLPISPKLYKSKSKNAQEAHEAIRPTDVNLQGGEIAGQSGFNRDHARLYDLIWNRFIACQMNEAVMDQTSVDVTTGHPERSEGSVANATSNELRDSSPTAQNDNTYLLRASGSIIKFDGWLKLYGKVTVDNEETDEKDDNEKILPEVSENDPLKLIKLLPGQHFTEPPPRYTEASLIKKLEELGIGRPSTYAPILSTIQERFYVERVDRKFIPTALGFTVTDFIVKYFSDIVDYQFTAAMEENLDEISRGEREWKPTLKEFYDPFEKKLLSTEEEAEHVKLEIEKAGKDCPECGKELIIRVGKFGKFLACSGFPDCKHTEALEQLTGSKCPDDGGEVVVRRTKKGKTFYGCKNYPNCKWASWTKPKEVNSV